MKKLIKYFLIIVIVVVAMPSKQSGLEDLIKPFDIKNAVNTYYTTNANNVKDAKITNCGSAVFVQSDVESCTQIKKKLSNIQGQSISFIGNLEFYNELVNKLINNKETSEKVANVQTCYGYNSILSNYVRIDNKKINIQISINNNIITIGTPVILGSY